MPIKIPDGLPAREILENENILVMNEGRAQHQDIRPLRIAILNLMPTKITTETQLIRLLSGSSLQIELTLLGTASHRSKNTSAEHMRSFYKHYSDVKSEAFDGLILTGAPVEEIPFEQVDYWDEMCEILEWSKTHVFSTLHICWAAQAGLYYHYGIPKYPLPQKLSGVYAHTVLDTRHPLLRGFDERFLAPHSRHTEIREEDIAACPRLCLLSRSDLAGVYIAADRNMRRYFITGHCEYDYDTLAKEYCRDLERGLNPSLPYHYFPNDDPTATPENLWRCHAHLLFANWLNHIVYPMTPFDLGTLASFPL